MDDPRLEENLYHSKDRLVTVLNQWMSIFPLWSGIFLGDLSCYSKDNEETPKKEENKTRSTNTKKEENKTRSTNSLVENYFGIIKQDIPKKKRLRPAEFVRKQYMNIKGKLSEIETVVPSSKKVSKKSTKKDQEQWKPKKDSSKKKCFYFTPPVKFPKPKNKPTKRKLQFDESPHKSQNKNQRKKNRLSRKKSSKTQNQMDEEEVINLHESFPSRGTNGDENVIVTRTFNRRFQNPDMATCWLNACLQLLLNGIDHFPYPPNFTSPLGRELFTLRRSVHDLDPTRVKEIIMAEERARKQRNPSAQFLDLASGQQCVRDFFLALSENEQAWPDVFDLFKFQLTEETRCGNRRCNKLNSSTHRPQIHLEMEVPAMNTDLSQRLDEELNTSLTVEGYHCEVEDGGCGKRLDAQHSTMVHSITDKNFLIVVLRRVREGLHGREINNDVISATDDVQIIDKAGNVGKYRPIAVIDYSGRMTGEGNTRGHYLCDIQTREGHWFRTNDNLRPVYIQAETVTKRAAVVLYYKR